MLGLGRLLNHREQGSDHRYDGLVEGLLQRVSEAALIEDRREALLQLKDLVGNDAQAQNALASLGYPVICAVLRDEREDIDMLRAAIECINTSTSQDNRRTPQDVQAASINAEQLARTPDAVTLLLSLLEERPVGVPDFYVRYHTLQTLRALLGANAGMLQEAILGSPLGVVRLMDLLNEQEVLRNEALLILQHLTSSNQEIQKIAAFEGAFERLFNIMREEGFMQGGVVVQDCLQLLGSLLRGNASNQLMFRELGYLSQLPGLLAVEPPESPPGSLQSMSEEKAANLAAGLQTIRILLAPAPPQRSPRGAANGGGHANEVVLLQHGLLSALLDRAFAADSTPDAGVRTQALQCLATLASSSQQNKDMLGATVAKASASQTLPVMHAALRVAVGAELSFEAAAADELIAAQCVGNAAAQAALASTIAPGAVHAFGGELLQALLRQGEVNELLASSRAAVALSHLMCGNAEVKQRALGIKLPHPGGGIMAACAQRLVAAVTAQGAKPQGQQLVANFTLLMLRWLDGCPAAVAAFLASVAQTPFLVGAVMSDRQFAANADVIRGMSALLLGVCARYAPPGAAISQTSLTSAITGQIGLGRYFDVVNSLLNCQVIAPASAPGEHMVHLAPPSMVMLRELAQSLRHHLGLASMEGNGASRPPPSASVAPAPPAHPVGALPRPSDAAKPAALIPGSAGNDHHGASAAANPPPAVGAQLPKAASAASGPVPESASAVLLLQREVEALRARNAELTHDVVRLSSSQPGPVHHVHSGESDGHAAHEVASLLGQLSQMQARVAVLEADVASARIEASEARAALQKADAELEGLSSAYASVDAHANEIQNQLEQAELRYKVATAGGASAHAGMDAAAVEQRVKDAVAAAVEEVQQEGDAAMEDLLVCLGQEESKVQRLREQLQALGAQPAE